MTKVYMHMAVKNEASRYLESCLKWNSTHFDGVHVYDDRSTDTSVEIATQHAKVDIRGENDPSFMESESKFRSNGLKSFFDTMLPEMGSWVISLDADEFFHAKSIRTKLDNVPRSFDRVAFPVREIWSYTNSRLSQRMDGYWGSIKQTRAIRITEDLDISDFPKKSMGCGSVPQPGLPSIYMDDAEIFHFGYASYDDRVAKYERYSSMSHGHSNSHINSILDKPRCAQVDTTLGSFVWRGYRG